jgi:hypothetical protein
MLKSIVQLEPLATVTPEEAERHYTSVHIAMAQRMYLHHAHDVERYVPQKVVAQYDVAGNFNRRPPDAWRFIVNHHEGGHYLSDAWRTLASEDHQNCMEQLRSYVVDEERTLVDRRSGQLSSAKFIFTFSAEAHDQPGDLAATLDDVARRFKEAAGARLFIANDITARRKVLPLARPGQKTTSEMEPSDLRSIVELYFDHPRWGRDFLADEDVRVALLLGTGARHVRGYQVVEEIGWDRR